MTAVAKLCALNDERTKILDMLNKAIGQWESTLVVNATGVAAELELVDSKGRKLLLTWSRFSAGVGYRLSISYEANSERHLLVDSNIETRALALQHSAELGELVLRELEASVEMLREHVLPLFSSEREPTKPKRRLQ